ncbi:AraC family transcriptional regulator [Escherichia coli]|uniref:AraC family transcriptional regulator n=1 Tax=Escherichia coli TaxID=562 RepID=A0A641CHA0_ECOLX|nr:AraC family transcriptional regulator [Escherichia coli]KAA1833611.1 AraC family transcriptional regulator [Escherichia coli]MDF1170864.1 AraC family transcriptional regulator [Escherichia coli]OXJ70517.1 hypothetical protein CDL50_24620 [Escherichia coli]OXJ86266.1 hypothetical protein CDL29_24855 [Escherichia coli]QDC33259.1 AraC family transcriptional regulator [Escherichia coli]
MGSCAAPSAKGDDKFITTDYLQQCQFDSQQSFTRRFKYIFKVTPSYYRRNKLWELEAMH